MGDSFVVAKVKGFPWWPAKVCAESRRTTVLQFQLMSDASILFLAIPELHCTATYRSAVLLS
jgi:hypothetical protein